MLNFRFRTIPKLFPSRFLLGELFAIAFFAASSVFFNVMDKSARQDLDWASVMSGKIMSAGA